MENRLGSASLAGLLAGSSGKNKKFCEDFIREFFKVASDALAEGDNVKIKAFGSFKLVSVEARKGVNVSTGESQQIPAYTKIVFTPSKEMAAIVNAPFAMFESVEIDDEMPEEMVADNNENIVEAPVLKAGSTEEDFDDMSTSEAYETLEKMIPQPDQSDDEDKISDIRLEEGSDEEDIDDISTAVAYQNIKTPTTVIKEMDSENKHPETTVIYSSKRGFGLGFFMGMLSTLVVCLIIFIIGCFLAWWPENFNFIKSEQPQISAQMPLQQEVNQNNSAEDTETPAITEEETIVEPEPEPVKPEPVVYDIVSPTRYLTTIAQEHYGNFNFWPYVYIENQNKLGHPDRITPGTRVVVPPLSKYGVDPKNPDDIKEAKRKGAEIYARYK